ncbi:MAG: hypothetical protein AB1750_13215, partial [Chloroflexota bacterium]
LAEWIDAFIRTLPACAPRLAPPPKPGAAVSGVINALIVILLSFAALANLFVLTRPERVDANLPVGAVAWIRANDPPSPMFNSYNWGGYLTWALPEYPVFIDGRADLYGDELITQWQDVVNARPNALAVLDRWRIKFVLLEPGWPVVPTLEREGWSVAYRDDKSVILIRP